jgi:hypothetical protein
MNNLVTLTVAFFLVAILTSYAFNAINHVRDVNFGNCTQNATGYWENCALSNSDAENIRDNSFLSSTLLLNLSYVQWLLVGGALCAAIFLFRRKG